MIHHVSHRLPFHDSPADVQVYRFPTSLCTDRRRRINSSEPDWDQTQCSANRDCGYCFVVRDMHSSGFT